MEIDNPWPMNFKNVSIEMTDGTTFEGKVNIGKHDRLSDLLKCTDGIFVTVVVIKKNGEQQGKVFMINKNSITWVIESEGDKEMLMAAFSSS